MKAALLLLALAQTPEQRERCDEVAQLAREAAVDVTSLPKAQAVQRARDAFANVRTLEKASTDAVPLRLPWLAPLEKELDRAEVRSLHERLDFTARRVRSICTRLAAVDEAPVARADRRALEQILSRPEYELTSPDDALLFRVFEAIRVWFRDVFAANELVQSSTLLTRNLLLGLVAALAAFAGVRLVRARVARRRRSADAAAAVRVVTLDDPAQYFAEARAARAKAEPRELLRLSWLGTLATLERARLASPGRAATNREVAAELAERGATRELADEAVRLVDWYDSAWYGLAPVSMDEAERFAARAAELAHKVQPPGAA